MALSPRRSRKMPPRPYLCSRGRRRAESLLELLERCPVGRYLVIDELVVRPFGPEQPVEYPRTETVVASVTRMVKRVVGRARNDLTEQAIEIRGLEFEICMTERVDDEIAD